MAESIVKPLTHLETHTAPWPLLKICGLTRRSDLELALELGAEALGFVFHPASPRAVMPTQVQALLRDLPTDYAKVARVGVFVNTPPTQILQVAEVAGLSHVQLHGHERLAEMQVLLASPYRCLKAVRLENPDSLAAALAWPAEVQVLVEAGSQAATASGHWGGSGQLANWELAARLAQQRPILLAGGLNPHNLAQAVAAVQPLGCDLASGVEAAPGHKDPRSLRALFAVRQHIMEQSLI